MSNTKLLNKKDLIAYFLVAGTGALVQFIAGSLLRNYLGLSYGSAIAYSYIIAFFVGFFLTKMFAFDARSTNQTRREMVKFVMVACFSGAVMWFFALASLKLVEATFGKNAILLPFLQKPVNVNELGSQVIGMGFSFISNYILHKTFTFKSTGFYDRLKALIR
ncbi:Putative flippase GtrA (transmembrane translocase of bactoprenol-linked glucose) [Pseudarcicella hirudinis]|uniref:Putative flippase GtrA (Transmembrane translocase of bactoprenol-linked glucose) n=1 Tax=Pseudarcicella hirudinis TaxID=1079859 RepID=A0A1I5QJE4_9BACT|nr:GtrA family protein [Pseudarcicella hirudinis]SFP46170.1 Putative flippase GtrA (transmembrane translocase of bactoprenol-linked glucose) [Pseudarcicella hirudinis]